MTEPDDELLSVATIPGPRRGGAVEASRLVTLTILHHPAASRVGERARLKLLDHARGRVAVSRTEPSFQARASRPVPLTSPFVSRKPLWIEAPAGGGLRLDASDCGSFVEVDGVPLIGTLDVALARLDSGLVVQLGTHAVLLLHRERIDPQADDPSPIIGASEAILELRQAIARVGAEPGPVLVRGETGSGKELVAAELHRASTRAQRPFVAVNMAAIPSALAASELFGHARGAFSGADTAHDGYFVRADGGTLFLDEIADTPADVQATLLRVLETGEVQALGARASRRVDVRVIAATDGDLQSAVAEGRFRAPLLYRLAASELRVPALRERRADIGRLLVHFLASGLAARGRAALLRPLLTEERPWLPASLVARMVRYAWPGNVRQLINVTRALVLASESPLDPDDAELERIMPGSGLGPDRVDQPALLAPPLGEPAARAPSAIGPDEVERVMRSLDFQLGAAAAWLGISRASMNELVDRHPRLRRAQRVEAAEIQAALAEARASGTPAWRLLEVSERGLQRRIRELELIVAS